MAINLHALETAIRIGGPSQRDFARRLSRASGYPLSQQTISHWVCTGCVPLRHLIYIERLTGVTCHELDPFHYPIPTHRPRTRRQADPEQETD